MKADCSAVAGGLLALSKAGIVSCDENISIFAIRKLSPEKFLQALCCHCFGTDCLSVLAHKFNDFSHDRWRGTAKACRNRRENGLLSTSGSQDARACK